MQVRGLSCTSAAHLVVEDSACFVAPTWRLAVHSCQLGEPTVVGIIEECGASYGRDDARAVMNKGKEDS